VFSATVPLGMRPAVEALFFFNPRQSLLREGIHATIAQTGMPTIVANDAKVWIDVPQGSTQCLFACDEGVQPFRISGVALYTRPAFDTIWIAHLAIDPDYSYGGAHATLEVARRLVGQVMTIAHSIKGIGRIQLPYRHGSYLRVPRTQALIIQGASRGQSGSKLLYLSTTSGGPDSATPNVALGLRVPYVALRRVSPRPTRPRPSSASVPGSGTVVGGPSDPLPDADPEQTAPGEQVTL